MIMKSMRRGSVTVTVDGRPAGILVLDRPPLPPQTQLRAYVWSRERTDHSAVPGAVVAEKATPRALMVGPKGSLPPGGWAFAV